MNTSTQTHEKARHNASFTPLDIVGISLSTLLFTLVWVGVFSVFLPERSEMLLTEGLRQVAAKSSSQSDQDSGVLHYLEQEVQKTSYQFLDSTLSVLQTGGNVTEVATLTSQKVFLSYCHVSSCSSSSEPVVLGASTRNSLLRFPGTIPFGRDVLGHAFEYLNTVTFGLVELTDSSFYHDVAPVRVVQKADGVTFSCSGSLCLVRR